ncbi:hypothetical protein, partial [Flavobacterium sp. GP15]|uniref:hypothetical protein n=1 Tax=Flavobacterium sp. GP15 TaxID=2758567 RepID=UPI001CB6FD04
QNKMQLKIKSPKIYVIVSLAIFTVSLTQTAISSSEFEDKTLSGIATLVMGGLSVLGGGILEWLIWLVNPLYFFSLYLFLKSKNKAKMYSLLSTTIALSFVTWNKILVSESGKLGNIDSLGLGYWLWVSSLAILTIGIFLVEKDNRHYA